MEDEKSWMFILEFDCLRRAENMVLMWIQKTVFDTGAWKNGRSIIEKRSPDLAFRDDYISGAN